MISIIIPTYNEEKCLPKLLDSIKKQTCKDYEVIVADGNSKDKTIKIAEEYGSRIVKGGSPARGRNRGAKAAKGEYLLFLDADVILPQTFLEKAIKQFNRKFFEIAPTLLKPISNIEIDKLIYKIHNLILIYASEIYPFTVGVSIIVTKRLHQKLGGFNEKMNLSEDNDYGQRAKKIARYGVINNTYANVSIRRLDKEGRIEVAKKYMRDNVSQILTKLGIKTKREIKYEFGNFNKIKSLSILENSLEKILRFLTKYLR